MSIDRAALIEAALIALDSPAHGYQVELGHIDDRDVSVVLDAVLPLIADAIEAQPSGTSGACHVAVEFFRRDVARLVRGLATRTGDDDA